MPGWSHTVTPAAQHHTHCIFSRGLLNFTLNSPRSKPHRGPHSSPTRFNGGKKKKKKQPQKIHNVALITSRTAAAVFTFYLPAALAGSCGKPRTLRRTRREQRWELTSGGNTSCLRSVGLDCSTLLLSLCINQSKCNCIAPSFQTLNQSSWVEFN